MIAHILLFRHPLHVGKTVYINFENDRFITSLFSADFDIRQITTELELARIPFCHRSQGDYDMVTTFKQTHIGLLKYDYYLGMSPEVVDNLAKNQGFTEALEMQQHILEAYE